MFEEVEVIFTEDQKSGDLQRGPHYTGSCSSPSGPSGPYLCC